MQKTTTTKPRRRESTKNGGTLSDSPIRTARTELGQRLAEIRARILAKGEPLLSWEGVECEIADRRGRDEEPEA